MALDDSLFRGRQIKVNFINRSLLYPKEAITNITNLEIKPLAGIFQNLQVMPKRTNKPGISTSNRAPRGRGYRGRSSGYRGRGGFGAMRRPR